MKWLAALVCLQAIVCQAQEKFAFSEVCERMESANWKQETTYSIPDTLLIFADRIEFTYKVRHVLKIVGQPRKFYTDDRNRVYHCRDASGLDVRVFVIKNEKIYLYFKKYHIKITSKK